MTPYSDIELGQQWLSKWHGAWWHQAITRTNTDLYNWLINNVHWHSSEGNIQEIPQPSVTKISLKRTHLKLHSDLSGPNGLVFTFVGVAECVGHPGELWPVSAKTTTWIHSWRKLPRLTLSRSCDRHYCQGIRFGWTLWICYWYRCLEMSAQIQIGGMSHWHVAFPESRP